MICCLAFYAFRGDIHARILAMPRSCNDLHTICDSNMAERVGSTGAYFDAARVSAIRFASSTAAFSSSASATAFAACFGYGVSDTM